MKRWRRLGRRGRLSSRGSRVQALDDLSSSLKLVFHVINYCAMGSRIAEYDHTKQAGVAPNPPIVWDAVKSCLNVFLLTYK